MNFLKLGLENMYVKEKKRKYLHLPELGLIQRSASRPQRTVFLSPPGDTWQLPEIFLAITTRDRKDTEAAAGIQ